MIGQLKRMVWMNEVSQDLMFKMSFGQISHTAQHPMLRRAPLPMQFILHPIVFIIHPYPNCDNGLAEIWSCADAMAYPCPKLQVFVRSSFKIDLDSCRLSNNDFSEGVQRIPKASQIGSSYGIVGIHVMFRCFSTPF